MQSVRSIPPRRLPLLQPLVVLLLLLGLAAQCLGNVETSYVFELNAREEMCYYEDALGEPRIKLEFQVLDGGSRDIDYTVFSPDGQLARSGRRTMETYFEIERAMPGTWTFCFGNTFSLAQKKKVYFALIMKRDSGDDNLAGRLDAKMKELDRSTAAMANHLREAQRIQAHLWAREARHRNTADTNYYRVNMFSAVQSIFIVLMGVIQVFVIRHFFGGATANNKF